MRLTRVASVLLFQALTWCGSMQAQETPETPRLQRRSVDVACKALAALAVDDQKVLFHTLPPDLKAAVWRQHLEDFVAEHPDLTVAQQAVIDAALELLVPELFASDALDSAWRARFSGPVHELELRVAVVFSRDTAALLLARLDSSRPASNSAETMTSVSTNGQNVRRPSVVIGNPIFDTDCECSSSSDWCFSGSWCNNQRQCKRSSAGCGTFWTFPCDGMCVTPP